jgi:hypothetical protein
MLIGASEPAAVAAAAGAPPAQVASCDAHKFETIVHVIVDGKPHQSKVHLCGTEGQSDADWKRTLEDAVRQVEGNDKMPAEVRGQIVAALKLEIGTLGPSATAAPVSSPPTSIVPLAPLNLKPKIAATAPETPLSNDYTVLPPLPAPKASVVLTASSLAARPLPLLTRPRLKLSCYNPGDLTNDGPCTGFTRDTLVTVAAGENLPPAVSLHFIRNGDDRGEVAVAQMKRGASMRVELPRPVCSGVVGGKLKIELQRQGQVVDTQGPYDLRC